MAVRIRRMFRRRTPIGQIGKEPDPRYSLANERTLLSYIRTSLALVVAGIGIIGLLPDFDVPGGTRLIGLPLITLGAAVALAGFHNWEHRERALRLDQAMPRPRGPALISYGIFLVAVVSAALALFIR